MVPRLGAFIGHRDREHPANGTATRPARVRYPVAAGRNGTAAAVLKTTSASVIRTDVRDAASDVSSASEVTFMSRGSTSCSVTGVATFYEVDGPFLRLHARLQ
jgi:hypothetical protein